MSFRVPICENCWPAYIAGANTDQFVEPTRVVGKARTEERCFSCLKLTWSGIYTRVHPAMQEAIAAWWKR